MLKMLIESFPDTAVYFLAALAFSLIWSTRREGLFHLALGGNIIIAAGVFNRLSLDNSLALAATIAILISTIIGLLIEIGAYRRLRLIDAPNELFLLASFGILLIIERLGMMWLGTMPLSLSSHLYVEQRINILGGELTNNECLTVIMALIIGFIAIIIFRGKTGRELIALRQSTLLFDWRVGNSRKALAIVSASSGAIAGLAIILFHLQHRVVLEKVSMGFLVPGFVAVTAAEGIQRVFLSLKTSFIETAPYERAILVILYAITSFIVALLSSFTTQSKWLGPQWNDTVLLCFAIVIFLIGRKNNPNMHRKESQP